MGTARYLSGMLVAFCSTAANAQGQDQGQGDGNEGFAGKRSHVELGAGVTRGDDGEGVFRYNRIMEKHVAIGAELSYGWLDSKSYGYSGYGPTHYGYETVTDRGLTSLAATASAGWPSIASGVYVLGLLGVGHLQTSDRFIKTTAGDKTEETIRSDYTRLVQGVALGARYTLPFGASIGVEVANKNLLFTDKQCVSPPDDSKEEACFDSTPLLGVYHVTLSYAF